MEKFGEVMCKNKQIVRFLQTTFFACVRVRNDHVSDH